MPEILYSFLLMGLRNDSGGHLLMHMAQMSASMLARLGPIPIGIEMLSIAFSISGVFSDGLAM